MLSNSVAKLDSSVAGFALCFLAFWFDIFQWPILKARNKTETYFQD